MKNITCTVHPDGSVTAPDGTMIGVWYQGADRSIFEQTTGVLVEVREIRMEQDLIYGQLQSNSQHRWHRILEKISGELSGAMLLKEEGAEMVSGQGTDNYIRDRWLELAAVSVAAVEGLDRETGAAKPPVTDLNDL